MPRILIAEDETNTARTLAKILERKGYEVATAANGLEALAALDRQVIDLVITDLKMPRMDGMGLLAAMRERGLTLPALVLTGYGTIQNAVEAMKLGAANYLIKPCNPEELLLIVQRELEASHLRDEVAFLRRRVREDGQFGTIVGESEPMIELYRIIEAVSQNRSNVLLTGESGTGKELVARTIHDRSPAASKPFLAVNCAGMSETLIDSQLFGHKRGAFTGAIQDHQGVFKAARGGTLFLDEIFEIPLSLQAKLLRALQEREVTPLGSTEPVPVEARIIAATNRDLEAEVAQGGFRSDLFYRLNVVNLRLPALRERKEDIPLLVEHFTRLYAETYGVSPKRITERATAVLLDHDWPGNVRELQNAIERAFALSREKEIDLTDLPPNVTRDRSHSSRAVADEIFTLEEMERRVIRAALDRSQGNKNEAARLLGIDRQRLYRKIAKYELD